MSFSVEDLSASGGTLVLSWEKVALRIPLTVDTEGAFAAAAQTAEGNVWRVNNAYARFILDSGGDLKKAMSLADKAVAAAENSATLRTKAEILAKMGDKSNAIKTMEKAIATGKAQNSNVSFLEDILNGWKSGK
jgi:hypothetical protein